VNKNIITTVYQLIIFWESYFSGTEHSVVG